MNKKLIYWAAGLSAGAVFAHAIDLQEHLAEWWGYSTFYAVVASFQFFYGIGLLLQPWKYDESGGIRPNADSYGRPYYIPGIILAGGSAGLYVLTRLMGLPMLSPAAAAAPVTLLGLIPAVENLALLAVLITLYSRCKA